MSATFLPQSVNERCAVALFFAASLLTASACAGPLGAEPAPASAAVELTLHEPLDRDWAPAWVSFPFEAPPGKLRPDRLSVADVEPSNQGFVVRLRHPDDSVKTATAYAFTPLKAGETRTFRVVGDATSTRGPLVRESPEGADRIVFSTDQLDVRAPAGSRKYDPPARAEDVPAPLLSVRRPGGAWLGAGRLTGLGPVAAVEIETDRSLPHLVRHSIRYRLAGGAAYAVRLTVTAHEPAVLVEEDFTALDRGEFRYDLGPGLAPATAQGIGRLHPPGATEVRAGYPIDFATPWIGRLQPFYAWWPNYGIAWAAWRPGGDYLGLFMVSPAGWRNPPPNTVLIHTGPGAIEDTGASFVSPPRLREAGARPPAPGADPERRAEAVFPLRRGTRRWGLLLAAPEDALRRSPGGANLVQRTMIRLAQNPLDKVKDLQLTWPGMAGIRHPHLLCRPEDLPAIREKACTHPFYRRVLEQFPDAPGDPAGLYLATGDEAKARAGMAAMRSSLRGWVEKALDGPNYAEGIMDIGFVRPLRSLALEYDALALSPSATPADRDYCLRAFAFLAWCLYDTDRWPPRDQGFHRGNINFNSDDYTCRAAVVSLLQGHPKQKAWMDYVEGEMRREFETSVFLPGGAWVEAPNYQGYTMHYLMIAMRIMQLHGFADFSKDARFRAAMDYFFRIQTPLDPRCGRHLLPTVGDTTSYYHSQSLQNVFSWAAKLGMDDPEFAGRMMFAWRRSGSYLFGAHGIGPGSGWTQPLLLTDPSIPERPPKEPLASERLPGYGALFRDNWDTDRESYFLFKLGPIDQHYDSDEGSFHWYALGAPLSLDFGCMYQPSVEQPWLHSTIDFDRRRPWSRGEVTAFASLPGVDFCSGQTTVTSLQREPDDPRRPMPPGPDGQIQWNKWHIDWRREALFVKGADYVVLRDTIEDAEHKMSTGWALPVLAPSATLDGPRARFAGDFGVNLDVFFAEPAAPALTTSRWGHPGHPTIPWAEERPMPDMGETQTILYTKAPADADYLAVLFPYRHGQAAPAMSAPDAGPEPDRGGGAVKVAHDGVEDLVFFAPTRGVLKSGDVTFSGRVGIVRRGGGGTTLHILDGLSLRLPEIVAQFPGPATLEIGKSRLRGVCDGTARTCTIQWTVPPPLPATLTMDGKEQPVYATVDGFLIFTVGDGRHEFEVTYEGK